jgi:hypothetical protein
MSLFGRTPRTMGGWRQAARNSRSGAARRRLSPSSGGGGSKYAHVKQGGQKGRNTQRRK